MRQAASKQSKIQPNKEKLSSTLEKKAYHTTVLQKEAIDLLHVMPDANYIDATTGDGGHLIEIAQKLVHGTVLGIDTDHQAIERAHIRIKEAGLRERVRLTQGNFSELAMLMKKNSIRKVHGVIFDLGVSSYQIDESKRGFSYLSDGPLDMRMNEYQSVTAADLINGLNRKELYELFRMLGEEPRSHRLVSAITKARKVKKICTTHELASIIAWSEKKKFQENEPWYFYENFFSQQPQKYGNYKKRARIFQALRMAVNQELNNIEQGLQQAVEVLDSGGRLVVISFHSLEDRAIKRFITERKEQLLQIHKTPIIPSDEEIQGNPRSRSAKMRCVEKK